MLACSVPPPCLIRLAITRHASRDVNRSNRLAHRLALRILIAFRPVPRHAGRGGVLASNAMSFMSARRDIIRPRFSSHYSSPRLLAPSPHAHQYRGRLRRSALTTRMAAAALSYRLGYSSIRSAPIRPAPRHEERGERRGGLSSCLVRASGLPVFRLCGSRGRRRFHSASCRFGLFELLARHLAIVGQYSGGLCGSSCGRVSIRLDRFPACFVSNAASYPLPHCPFPFAPCRLIRPVPMLASPSSSR